MATKAKLTAYVDPLLHRAMKVRAARTGRKESEIVEEALKRHLGFRALEESQALSTLSEEEAMRIAIDVVKEVRREHPLGS